MILVAFAYIALVIAACFGLLVILEAISPNAARGWFGQVAEDNEADVSRLDALDSDRLRVCGHSNGRLSCDRAALHDGPHGDRHTMPGDRPVLWVDGELGLRSLDEIRRDAMREARRQWDGGGSDAA